MNSKQRIRKENGGLVGEYIRSPVPLKNKSQKSSKIENKLKRGTFYMGIDNKHMEKNRERVLRLSNNSANHNILLQYNDSLGKTPCFSAAYKKGSNVNLITPKPTRTGVFLSDVSSAQSPWGMAGSTSRGHSSAYTSRCSIKSASAKTHNGSMFFDKLPFLLYEFDRTLTSARMKCIAWLCKTAVSLNPPLKTRTVFIAVEILDRYIIKEMNDNSNGVTTLKLAHKMEVIGFAALYLASKLEDYNPVDLDDIMISVRDKKYPIHKANIVTEERKILNQLSWQIHASLLDYVKDTQVVDYTEIGVGMPKKMPQMLAMICESLLFNALYLSLNQKDIVYAAKHLCTSLDKEIDAFDEYTGNMEALYLVIGCFSYLIYRWRRLKQNEQRHNHRKEIMTVSNSNNKKQHPLLSSSTSSTRPTSRESVDSSATNCSVISSSNTPVTQPDKPKVSTVLYYTMEKHRDLLETLITGLYERWSQQQRTIMGFGGLCALRDSYREAGFMDVTITKRGKKA